MPRFHYKAVAANGEILEGDSSFDIYIYIFFFFFFFKQESLFLSISFLNSFNIFIIPFLDSGSGRLEMSVSLFFQGILLVF